MPHPEVPDDYRPPPDEGGAVTWRRSDLNLMRRGPDRLEGQASGAGQLGQGGGPLSRLFRRIDYR